MGLDDLQWITWINVNAHSTVHAHILNRHIKIDVISNDIITSKIYLLLIDAVSPDTNVDKIQLQVVT